MSKVVIHIPNQLREHMIALDKLVPYDKNPRKHSKKSQDALKQSITKDGFIIPITINQDNKIIAGHGRRMAAIELGMTEVPFVMVHTTDEEYVRLVLSDNKIAELSKWDNGLLKETMEYLENIQDAELFVPGFTSEDLDKIFGTVVKETLETKADFGDAGEVTIDDDARVTSMTLKMTVNQHKKVKAVMGAIMREHNFETLGECMVHMISKFQGPAKTIRRQA